MSTEKLCAMAGGASHFDIAIGLAARARAIRGGEIPKVMPMEDSPEIIAERELRFGRGPLAVNNKEQSDD